MKKVTKAVIPAAGLGTRFLPATKAQPKEMLPVVDKPAIQYVVEEAVAAGIDDILIITGRNKRSLEDHFDRNFELEYQLEAKGKTGDLAEVVELAELADIHFVRQGEPLGLGHAVSVARKHVGDNPFVVMLGDDIMDDQSVVLEEMIKAYVEHDSSVVALMEVPKDQISAYGCAGVDERDGSLCRINEIVEKPDPAVAPSNLGVMGRYLFSPAIFDLLDDVRAGRRGRDPADRRHREAVGDRHRVRLRLLRGPLRHRQEDRLPPRHGGAGPAPRRPRTRVPGVPDRRRPTRRTGLTAAVTLRCH